MAWGMDERIEHNTMISFPLIIIIYMLYNYKWKNRPEKLRASTKSSPSSLPIL